MDLRLLEIFCRVYEARSFSKAAERLGLSQPTVSGHVKALEAFFGTALFDRLGRETEPTPAGRLLYRHGWRIVEMKQVTVEAMDRFLNRLEGRLHLGASTIPGEYLLPPILGRFHQACPGIQVTLTIHDTREIIADVREGRLELGFVGAALEEPGLELRQFADDEVILVAPATPPWQRLDDRISLEQLKERSLLMREEGSGTRMALERKLRELGHGIGDFDVVAELGSTTAVKEAVKAGLGAAFLSSLSVRADLAAGWMRNLRLWEIDKLQRAFFTVANVERASSPLREAFLEFLALKTQAVA